MTLHWPAERSPRAAVVVLAPGARLEALESFLSSEGWTREPDRAAMNAGQSEPVFVSWSLPERDGELDYTFEPETGVRFLEVRGPDALAHADALGRNLPAVTSSGVERLLRATAPGDVRQGLRMAGLLRDGSLAQGVLAQLEHPDPSVRELAREILEHALTEMAPARGGRDDALALFLATPDPGTRRQILRWLGKDHPALTARIEQVLEAALEDPDWEVRTTALLLTGRYGARRLAVGVRSCRLSNEGGLGPTRHDAPLFETARRAVLHLLAGQPLPSESAVTLPAQREQLQVARCILGNPVARDHVFLLFQALTEPLPPTPAGPPPHTLPRTLLATPEGYRFEPLALPLAWVPPLPHWLGDEQPGMAVPNPIRRITPSAGFLVTAKWFSPPQQEGPFHLTFEQAETWAATLSQRFGVRFRLPTADEWEMAARGPDGRLFPWGNGMESSPGATSPWGCGDLFRFGGEWTRAVTEAGGPVVCGSSRRGCAWRAQVEPTQTGVGVRFVIELS
ncbi:SUMF1/EgtB/PvdO family nonheme iron enzyme [Archangium violaceum]|uniref:SUMF1/EgtB/PvdO family nonheme iron enzyme n=1 Tax=Archangium violaceum TaxID=83451 RepID=UPI00195236EF|nr:SUMF1/EgtB/PvdO family nonheme iron enzyme [Archangium violaceum]QRN93116.1 SUMF1/EgtB/PvdO family nonheme iron enzyme [Archangium violaceum]